jgi:uncharacterized protein (TIGR02058 family)
MSGRHGADGRAIIEMGMGNSLHRRDYTKAALRAVEDAMRHSSLAFLAVLEIPRDQVRVRVSIGVQAPGAVNAQAIADHLGGAPEVVVELGGLDVTDAATGEVHVVAAAAVEVFVPRPTGWTLRSAS